MALTDLISLGFIQYRTRYVARTAASNLADHLLGHTGPGG